MTKMLITGVAGFIGSHVARRFIAEGYDVVGVDDLSSGRVENVPREVCFMRGDLSLAQTVERIPKGCETILHLAGQSSGEISFDDPISDLHKNTVSTLNLIRYGINNHSRRIVFASSMSVYGAVPDSPISEHHIPQPLSCYGVGKLAAEGYLKVFSEQLPFVALRMFNVYGPGQDLTNLRQGMVSIFLAQALTSGRIYVKGSSSRFRDFICIDDVVEAWWRATTYKGVDNKVINVGTGRKTTVGELLDHIRDAVPSTKSFIHGSTPGDQRGIYADTSELYKVLSMNTFGTLDVNIPLLTAWARESLGAKKSHNSVAS